MYKGLYVPYLSSLHSSAHHHGFIMSVVTTCHDSQWDLYPVFTIITGKLALDSLFCIGASWE